jgi:ElaA protein
VQPQWGCGIQNLDLGKIMIMYQIRAFETLMPTELYDIMALREEVFTLEQHCTVADFDGLDKQAIHVFAIDNHEIIATMRILPPNLYKPGVVSFGRLAVKKSFRGKGYAKEMMDLALKYIDDHFPKATIVFSAQLYLQKFYEGFGFKAVGDIYDEAGILHIKMKK